MAPDGSVVAFQRCGVNTCGIYVINTDGSGLRRVDDGCGHLPPRCTDNSYPAISPRRHALRSTARSATSATTRSTPPASTACVSAARASARSPYPRRAPPWTSSPSGRRTASRSFRPPQRHRQAGRRAGRLRDQSPRHRASARHAVPDQGLATAPTGRPTARRSSSAAPRPRTSCAATSGRSTPTAPLCGGPARRPADKGLLGVILPRRHGDHLPVGRGRRSDDVAGGANGRPCDVLGLAHLGTDAHLGAQPRRLRERTLRKFRDSPRRPAAALHRLPLTGVQAVVLVVKPGTPAADGGCRVKGVRPRRSMECRYGAELHRRRA